MSRQQHPSSSYSSHPHHHPAAPAPGPSQSRRRSSPRTQLQAASTMPGRPASQQQQMEQYSSSTPSSTPPSNANVNMRSNGHGHVVLRTGPAGHPSANGHANLNPAHTHPGAGAAASARNGNASSNNGATLSSINHHQHQLHQPQSQQQQPGPGPGPAAGAAGGAGQRPGQQYGGADSIQSQAMANGVVANGIAGPPGAAGADVHGLSIRSVIEKGAALNVEAAREQGFSVERRRALPSVLQKLDAETEGCYSEIGTIAWNLGDTEKAVRSFDEALRRNPYCLQALEGMARYFKEKEDHYKVFDFAARALALDENGHEGEMWSTAGHALLLTGQLHQAYSCYQQAIAKAVRKDDPKLWYGIGILYDRYGSMEHAEEAFASVLKLDPNFFKRDEVFFRLGIIYKLQGKADASLECFHYIMADPPPPLKQVDVWYQIGHALELKKDLPRAKEAYERVLRTTPDHAKVLQHLGGIYLRENSPFYSPEECINCMTRSLEHDAFDPFSWYLLGRAFMQLNNYGKAYEAYQQAVYRDGKNPAYWCSIGVLYFNISQYHDALDAYTRAVRIHPFIPEIWQNLGILYESCHDQLADALDAYQRAHQLDDTNAILNNRLAEVRAALHSGAELTTPAPAPLDIMPDSKSWSTIHFDLTGAKPVYLDQRGATSQPSPPSENGVDHRSPPGTNDHNGTFPGPSMAPRRVSNARPISANGSLPSNYGPGYEDRRSRHQNIPGRGAMQDYDREPAILNRRGGSGRAARTDRGSPVAPQDPHFGHVVSPAVSPRTRAQEYEFHGQGRPPYSQSGRVNSLEYERGHPMEHPGGVEPRSRHAPPSGPGSPPHAGNPQMREYPRSSAASSRRAPSPPRYDQYGRPVDASGATRASRYAHDYPAGQGGMPVPHGHEYCSRYDPRYDPEEARLREQADRRDLDAIRRIDSPSSIDVERAGPASGRNGMPTGGYARFQEDDYQSPASAQRDGRRKKVPGTTLLDGRGRTPQAAEGSGRAEDLDEEDTANVLLGMAGGPPGSVPDARAASPNYASSQLKRPLSPNDDLPKKKARPELSD